MVETDRLLIIPLNREQLELYLEANGKLENKLQLTESGRTFSPEVKKMVLKDILVKMKAASGDNFLYFTFWIVVQKATKLIVAELGFKGLPSERGEIEIGYGTMPFERRKGFMTEALGGMVAWAKTQSGVRAILAETEETNLASIRIVQKNNFLLTEKKGDMLWWKILL